jgi:hypothetical protein
MRCRPYVLGATLVLGLACLASVAHAGSGYVPAPQSIHGPIATEQAYPSAQGGCAPCGPVETCCYPERKHCLAGLKCKLGGAGHKLKCGLNDMGCGVRGGLCHMRGKLGGCFKHKRAECVPVCETGCGEVWPSGQGVYPAGQGGPVATPPGFAAPQGASFQH